MSYAKILIPISTLVGLGIGRYFKTKADNVKEQQYNKKQHDDDNNVMVLMAVYEKLRNDYDSAYKSMQNDISECGFDKEKLNILLSEFETEKEKQSKIRQDLYHYSENHKPHTVEFTILNLKLSICTLERNLAKSAVGIINAVILNKRGDASSSDIVGGVGWSIKNKQWKTRHLSEKDALSVPCVNKN